MTPTMSLVMVCVLIIFVTVWQVRSRSAFAQASSSERLMRLARHLAASVLAGGAVWLVNWAMWADWPDPWPVLPLLVLEGIVGGSITAFGLYGWAMLDHSDRPDSFDQSGQPGGVVRIRNYKQTRGVLPGGVAVVWNERRGCWSTPEAALEDERNALAG